MNYRLLFYTTCLVSCLTGKGEVSAQTGPASDSLTVYVFLHDECVISQFYTPELARLHSRYRDHHVGIVGYFPNPATTPEKMEAFALTYKLAFPMKADYEKELARSFGIQVTPEVAVLDHRTDRMIYRGRIDDSYARVGKRRLHVQHRDLENILSSWVSGQAPDQLVETQAIGCFINFTVPPEKN